MNGINQLIARGGGVTQPMPDIMRSYRGALSAKVLQNQLRAQPEERAWRRESRGRKREEWAQTDEDRKFEREIKALDMALKAPTAEKRKAIYKHLNPDGADYDFEDKAGGNIKISSGKFEVEGPQQAVQQLIEHFKDNPQWYKDPAITNQIFESATALGVNVSAPEEEEEPKATYEHHTIYNLKDPTKTKRISYKKGEDYTPPEGWSLSKPEKGKKGISEKAKAETKKLTDIASDYQQAIGRYYTLMSGVGIMSEALGKKNEKMAQEAKEQADTLAKQYKELGGDVADLGVMEAEDKSLRDRAIELLKANDKVINEETITKVMDKLEGK